MADEEFNIAKMYTQLVADANNAATEFLSAGHIELASLELMRAISTGMSALVMLGEGQLKATAMLVDLALEERSDRART